MDDFVFTLPTQTQLVATISWKKNLLNLSGVGAWQNNGVGVCDVICMIVKLLKLEDCGGG